MQKIQWQFNICDLLVKGQVCPMGSGVRRWGSDHIHKCIILCLRDPYSQPNVDWPPKSTGRLQTIPDKLHSFEMANSFTPVLPHHPNKSSSSPHFESSVGGATLPPHNHTHSTPSSPFLQPLQPLSTLASAVSL